MTLTDGIGRRVQFPAHPERIVSLAPSVTEVLYLLGVQQRVVGVTTHCDWPEEVRAKPRIGTLLNPNYELILASKPDLVIASTAGNDRQSVLKLADLGLPVFVTAPRNVDTILETVEAIARIAGNEERGEELVRGMKRRIEVLRARLAGSRPVRAFFITWFDPLLAPGRETFESSLLRLAGVESITEDIDDFYPRYSLEQVIARDPDVLLTVRHSGHPLPDLRHVSGWKELRAVRKGRVFVLSETFQHPSPRFLDALEELARLVHPEQFR